ncbi:A24 family peptidase [Mycobacterium sp. TY814]|uniref:prepilin peptidase n=1 Tax=unclassified Mycobacterium TaxID=2642494 RepID=UPI002741BD33|nr:A24 family peptidase [Mycobacterium sp. TY814]MDP7721046.1 A24 family peptidase [Mycobacterium sp. TY814]
MRIGIGIGIVAAWLVALSYYDVRERRLPNRLTLPGGAVILIGAVLAGRGTQALMGGLALTAVYLAVHLAAPAAMGAGDVKLAVGLGELSGCFGVEVWLLAALGAPLLTAAVGLLCGLRTVPHGPSMCVATGFAMALAIA